MRLQHALLALLLCLPATAQATYSTAPKQNPAALFPPLQTQKPVAPPVHSLRRVKTVPAIIPRLEAEVAALRRELAQVRDEVRAGVGAPHPLFGWRDTFPLLTFSPAHAENAEPFQLASLPDLRQPGQEPAMPVPAAVLAVDQVATEDRRIVARAVDYLIRTATPGYTMLRQGIAVAIGRLHPAFVVKLAEAIRKARVAGAAHAGVFSAYRPPAFGIGGFGDKFNSLHSYGLAVDMTGIGGPGSRLAHLWEGIVHSAGLYLPYGPDNRAEFNHTQMVPTKMASRFLRATITASAPKNLRAMWLASGVTEHVPEDSPVESARLLPANEYSR